MRLSTERDRDEARAVGVLHTAFDAGVTVLDTADAYCWDAAEAGHNERLIARALAAWGGDRSRIVVATKGGLTRPQGDWVADGRARDDREYREYLREEQRSQAGCIAGRMQTNFGDRTLVSCDRVRGGSR